MPLDRSFGVVDEKVFEADFFLERFASAAGDVFAARCYFNAFVSSARSVTFTLQAVMKPVDGFRDWYMSRQDELRQNSEARFFVRIRNDSQHTGFNPLNAGSMRSNNDGKASAVYWFSAASLDPHIEGAPDSDVETACRSYLRELVTLVYECYRDFGDSIDPQVYYSEAALRRRSWTVEDLEEHLGLPRGWTDSPALTDSERIHLLQYQIPDSRIDSIFEKYLGKSRPSLSVEAGD